MSKDESTDSTFGVELEGQEVEHRSPANRRAAAHSHAEVMDESELAQSAQRAESEYGNVVENQREREEWFRNLKARLENRAGDENQPVNEFLASARKTGLAEINGEWDFDSTEYLMDGEEAIEFAEEGQELMNYFESQSGQIDRLSEQVAQFTGLISSTKAREEEKVSSIDSQLEEAESQMEARVQEAESNRDQEVDGLKDQISNMASSDLDESSYDEPSDLWEDEWDDISGQFNRETQKARQEYEERRSELQDEKEQVREDHQQQRATLKDQKQDLVSERKPRLDEIETVHAEFSNDVVEYSEEQAEHLEDLIITLRSLENMRDEYDENSVAEALDGSPELSQDQRGVSQDITGAANAVAYRALRRIDHLEDAVSDYGRAVDRITDELDEQDQRVGTRMDEVMDQYENLVDGTFDLEDEQGMYGIDSLRERVQDHVEGATAQSYDAVDEFREEIESMGRMAS